jgi:hypothetical protein
VEISSFARISQILPQNPFLKNVWVRDKQTGDVCMWRRDTETKDIEHQESDRELITINEKTHSIQAISQNGAVREIRHYLFWQPTCHEQTSSD